MRIMRQWRANTRRHPFEKSRPFNDERFRSIQSALALVADEETAAKMLAKYQTETTSRGSVYASAMAMADAQTKRGSKERAELHRLITMAHHACFNLKAI